MRLTLVNQFYAPDISPTAQLAASLAEHRAELGDEVTVITGRAGYLEGLAPEESGQPSASVQVRRVWTPHLGKSALWRRLLGYLTFLVGATARLLVQPTQDVVISMTTPPFLVTSAVLHKLLHRHTRVLLWSMDCYPDAAERFGELRPGGLMSRMQRGVNRWAFRHIEHVVGLDGAMIELLQSQYAAAPGQPVFSVIPNWERLEEYPPPSETTRWPEYERLNPANLPVLLYLGNAGVGHRFDTVLDAAEKLREEAVVVFVGGGVRTAEISRAVAARSLTNVVLHGYVPKDVTPAVMAGADAALITLDDRSLGVMSPSKLHATLAAGLPVLYVGPAGSNVDEAISRYGCGTSVRQHDVEGLVAAVRSLGADPSAPARSRAAFEQHYSDAAALPQWDAILDA